MGDDQLGFAEKPEKTGAADDDDDSDDADDAAVNRISDDTDSDDDEYDDFVSVAIATFQLPLITTFYSVLLVRPESGS